MAVSEIFRIKETVLFSLSVMSDSLWPLELQHARLPCPSPSPRIRSYSCPLNWWCHPIISSCHLLLLLPSVLPSIRVISIASALQIRWSKYWSFSFSISPSNEYSGLISFRIDQFDLLEADSSLKNFSITCLLLSYHK